MFVFYEISYTNVCLTEHTFLLLRQEKSGIQPIMILWRDVDWLAIQQRDSAKDFAQFLIENLERHGITPIQPNAQLGIWSHGKPPTQTGGVRPQWTGHAIHIREGSDQAVAELIDTVYNAWSLP